MGRRAGAVFSRLFGREKVHVSERECAQTSVEPPLGLSEISIEARRIATHADVFRSYYGSLSDATYLDLSDGQDLSANILLHACGLNRQIVFEDVKGARPAAINKMIARVAGAKVPGMVRGPANYVARRVKSDLKKGYGIDCRPPVNPTATGLKRSSIDLIGSARGLGHLPWAELRGALTESRRLCHGRTVLSLFFDYAQEYHHHDLQALLPELGFEVLHEESDAPDSALEDDCPVPFFCACDRPATPPMSAHFVLRRKAAMPT